VERAELILDTTDPGPEQAGLPVRASRRTRLLLWLGEGSWDTLRRRLLALADIQAVVIAGFSVARFAPAGLRATAWAPGRAQPILEAQRTLVYVSALLALLLLAGRSSVEPLLAGTSAGITLLCAYGLGTRLFPERLGIFDPASGYRLSEPIGYWNGLGLLAAVGAVLAASFAANASARAWRALAGAGLVVLLPTLYFTFSRGAWLALAAGLAAAIALEARRLRLIALWLALAPAPAVAVWLASRESSLRRDDTALAQASRAGHHLALVFLGLAAAAAATALAAAFVEPRLRVRPRARGTYAVALLVAAAVGLSLVLVRYGGPDTLAQRAYDAFNAPPPSTSDDLNSRLASFSGSWRSNMWRVAWHDYEAHPWLGSGAGSYDRYWDRNRDIAYSVRDAHSLYLETLAELGPLGLALLVAALGIPLVAAFRSRRSPLVPAAFGAYVAYLLHAGVDWDWELAGVTVAALLVAGALVLAGRPPDFKPGASRRRRLAVLAALAPVTGFVVFALVGNNAADSSTRALLAQRFEAAASDARKAVRWTPWSAEPWLLLGQAQLEQGERRSARASFARAISKDDGDWESWYGLALASDGAAARRALDRALRLDPREPVLVTARSYGLAGVAPRPTARIGVRR